MLLAGEAAPTPSGGRWSEEVARASGAPQPRDPRVRVGACREYVARTPGRVPCLVTVRGRPARRGASLKGP